MGRGIRWVAGGISVLLLAVAVGWALFVPAADWVARHDVGSARGGLAETARDNARGRLLTLGAGLFAASALVFTARNFTLSREGQVTDRYTKAIAQLGDEKAPVRLGGIYALERIARDSAKDHPTVMEVLTAFVREQSRGQPSAGPGSGDAQPKPIRLPPGPIRPPAPVPPPADDVQAALTVVGRRDAKRDIRRIYLRGADLAGADFGGADFGGADLIGAHLEGAHLTGAHLEGAHLDGAHLDGAHLDGAHLDGAHLNGTHLTRAVLWGADLTSAEFTGADLTASDFSGAHLDGAYLGGAYLGAADFINARLSGADLTGAHFVGSAHFDGADLSGAEFGDADLRGAHLTSAKWLKGRQAPAGWERDADSGLLRRAATPGATTAEP